MKLLLRLLASLLLSAGILPAQTTAVDPAMGITTVPLYDSLPPESTSPADVPTLTVFLPQPGRANGSAIVIAPGGAYLGLASNLEGRQVADWFAARGVTAFVLKYRLGPKNLFPIPLLDAERAIRLVRSWDKRYSLDPNRVGIIGFSAGGHLAAITATLAGQSPPASADPVDRLSDRPDFLILGYPWLNAMEPAIGTKITYCSVEKNLSPAQCAEFDQEYTPRLHVSHDTPPTFIYATSDDAVVPVSASVDFYTALVTAGVPVEMHLFRRGKHGSGLGSGDPALDRWPSLLEEWLREQGLLPPPASAAAP